MSFLEFLESITTEQASLISYLDGVFVNQCNMTRKMRYKVPFYDSGKWVCYLNPNRKEIVELSFLQGKELSKHYPILDKKGRKMVASLILDVSEDIPIDIIMNIIKTAKSLLK